MCVCLVFVEVLSILVLIELIKNLSCNLISAPHAGVHKVTLDSVANSVVSRRDEGQRLTFPILAFFAPLAGSVSDFVSNYKTEATGLRAPVRFFEHKHS